MGKRLKAYYDDVASEPVPDRFLSLLDALDAAESSSKAGSK
ncbi:NepR family anti-sigma factor [Aurantimonas coralicida]